MTRTSDVRAVATRTRRAAPLARATSLVGGASSAAADPLAPLRSELHEHPPQCYALLHRCLNREPGMLLRSDLLAELDGHLAVGEGPGEPSVLAGGELERAIRRAQEAVVVPTGLYLAVRRRPGSWRYLRLTAEPLDAESVPAADYLAAKERLVGPGGDGTASESRALEIDFAPFERGFPKLTEIESIGHGVEYLNRRLCAQLFADDGSGAGLLAEFLRLHEQDGRPLLLDRRIDGPDRLREVVAAARERLGEVDPQTPWLELAGEMAALGLLPGWGATAGRAAETLTLLARVLEAPDHSTLESLLARVPMIFRIAIVSPHGFFGQQGVLGLPDTGGQVVYILDQVRALESEMRRRLEDAGIDAEPRVVVLTRLIPEAHGTTADQPHEHIAGTKNATILRVPFRDEDGTVVRHWVSRFDLWPYLERFTDDAERELRAELGGVDLVIGNYSDGNLVATLLSRRLEVTQCAIAHALEKTKYLMADLYWRDNDATYHFATQFTADLVAMNAADFILTSTRQEIAGTEDSVGQYESYGTWTLPGLYRVIHGVDVYDPKFNIVPPGADAETFFPHAESERRLTGLHEEIEELVLGGPGDDARGRLREPERPLIFSMARLDRIKNLTGLVEWYASSADLKRLANLLVIGGRIDPAESTDREERDQIERMHELLDRHQLDGSVRWLGVRLDKATSGELYRWVADRRGVFVQPALFEAFGLTVIEAMVSGLPTFATRWGGPSEIIEHGVSGFHVDPNRGDEAVARIADFLERSAADPEQWRRVSKAGVERVLSRYTWRRHAERLMTLARVYGFWRHVTGLEREETRRYLELLYGLQYRPLARAVG